MQSPEDDLTRKDTLTLYGFSFVFPASSSLEFNPKQKREGGDIAVKSPEKSVVFFSWGSLSKLKKSGTSLEAHAKFSVDRIKKAAQGKMKSVEQRDLEINGHRALLNHVTVEVPSRGFFGKGREQEVRSVHLHCEESDRYFVVYATANGTNNESQWRTIGDIAESLRCH